MNIHNLLAAQLENSVYNYQINKGFLLHDLKYVIMLFNNIISTIKVLLIISCIHVACMHTYSRAFLLVLLYLFSYKLNDFFMKLN